MKALSFCLGVVVCGLVQAVPLQLKGSGPYYRVSLPPSIYTLAKQPDLSDLRLRNAAGEPLPWAWDQGLPSVAKASWQQVPVFAVPVGRADAAPALSVRKDGTLAWQGPSKPSQSGSDWIIDAHALKGSLLRLSLESTGAKSGLFAFSLEASDDLAHWRSVVDQAAYLSIPEQGLLQNEVALDGVRARYLRLRWHAPDRAPNLLLVGLQSVDQVLPQVPAQHWSDALAPSHCETAACTWRLPPGLPLERLRVHLAELNTIADVRVVGQSAAAPAATERRRHHLLPAKHRHEAKPTTARAPLGRSVVYRVQGPNQAELVSPSIELDGQVHAELRLEARDSIKEWGSSPPRISLGHEARQLLVLMRGAGPLDLSWGDASKPGGPLALAVLSVGLGDAAPSLASLSLPPLQWLPSAAVAAPSAVAAPAPAPANATHPWLWAALAGGLLMLGLMVRSLLNQVGRSKAAEVA